MPREILSLPSRKGRPEQYPWDEYTDGTLREFIHGTPEQVEAGEADFSCKPSSFESLSRQAMKSRGFRIQTATTEDGVAWGVVGPYVGRQSAEVTVTEDSE